MLYRISSGIVVLCLSLALVSTAHATTDIGPGYPDATDDTGAETRATNAPLPLPESPDDGCASGHSNTSTPLALLIAPLGLLALARRRESSS